MSQWFRFYNEVLDDPKIQKLPLDAFKGWVNLLCLAARNDGAVPPVSDVAFALRLTDAKAETLVETLVAAELLDRDETGIRPHNWNGRQFKTDVSTERVKRFRKRHETVSETPTETAPETESETEQIQSRPERVVAPPAPAADAAPESDDDLLPVTMDRRPEGEAVGAWNAMALRWPEKTFPQVQRLTRSREAALRQRLAEAGGLEGWSVALAKIEASSFLNGTAPRSAKHQNWRCTFDFIVKAENFTKLMEGNFDDGAPQNPTNGFAAIVTEDQFGAGAGDGGPGELHPD